MRILLLSWYFPPINEIGAIRTGKLAEYLHEHGHEVWVVTASREHADKSLPLALPESRIVRTKWFDVDRVGSPWQWLPSKPPKASTPQAPDAVAANPAAATKDRSWREAISEHHRWLIRFPDRQGGWLPYLRRAAERLLKEKKFDLIFASGPPFTAFVAADRLSRKFNVPWIAEYRDGWSRYAYAPKPEWRERIDVWLENRVTETAKGIVAVSEPWGDFYLEKFGKPTIAVYNGFDPTHVTANPAGSSPGLPVSIVHMGTIYASLRDPSVLFQAIKLANAVPGEIEVAFYGAAPETVWPLADKFGVRDFVKVPPRVPYGKALEIQRNSDVLLLLQAPIDMANVPGKTFEYFAARRPILGLGLDEGIPAKLVRDRKAGCYVTDPKAVAEQLKSWIEQKRNNGVIAALPESASLGLSRAEQFTRLESFLAPLI